MSTTTISDKGKVMLADLHPQMAESPTVQRVEDAIARELQRVEDAAAGIRDRVFPWNADDTYGTLAMWELTLGLPVEPSGLDVAARQELVAASVHKRRAASGAEWTALISQALGATLGTGPSDWYQDESGYTLIILVPPASFGQLVFIRRITPAHLALGTGLTGVFLIGISLIGDDL